MPKDLGCLPSVCPRMPEDAGTCPRSPALTAPHVHLPHLAVRLACTAALGRESARPCGGGKRRLGNVSPASPHASTCFAAARTTASPKWQRSLWSTTAGGASPAHCLAQACHVQACLSLPKAQIRASCLQPFRIHVGTRRRGLRWHLGSGRRLDILCRLDRGAGAAPGEGGGAGGLRCWHTYSGRNDIHTWSVQLGSRRAMPRRLPVMCSP